MLRIRLFVIATILALSACDGTDPSDCDTVVIGAGVPLSGGSEGTGQNVLRALLMALDDVNAEGGVNGRRVELAVRDDGSGRSQPAVRSVADDLASDECVIAVLGHLNSSATLWAQDVYDAKRIVNLTPVSTASSIASNSAWTFRNITHNGYKGRFLAEYTSRDLGIERVGIIFDDDAFGNDLKSFFTDEAGAVGLTIVGEASYSRTLTPDEIEEIISSAVKALIAEGAQAVYASGLLDEGVVVVNQVRAQAGADMPIIWSGWEEPLLIEEAGANAEGVHVPIHRVYDQSNPDVGAFVARFQDKFGQSPGAFAPFAYDAFGMLVGAIRVAGSDRAALRSYLAGVDSPEKAYEGLTGHIYFDEDGDLAEHFISALVVKDGKFVPYEE